MTLGNEFAKAGAAGCNVFFERTLFTSVGRVE
jgi:hypothetical protein